MTVWPREVVGSRNLGEALALDHKAAHALAQDAEAEGLITIEPLPEELLVNWIRPDNWNTLLPPFVYRRRLAPSRPVDTYLASSSLLENHVTQIEDVDTRRRETTGRNGASAYDLREDRWSTRGSLGRGPLWLTWCSETRDRLRTPVKASELISWSGAHRNDVSRWLARMEAAGAATHIGRGLWSLHPKLAVTYEEWIDLSQAEMDKPVADRDAERFRSLDMDCRVVHGRRLDEKHWQGLTLRWKTWEPAEDWATPMTFRPGQFFRTFGKPTD